MPLIRFRIRTMMIVVASLALLMGLLMVQFRLLARMDAGALFVIELAAIIVFVVPLLILFYILAAYFRREPTRRGQFSMTDDPPRRPDRSRSGESKRA
jgi:amino acid transporter